jgi:hypothetical protein
MCFVLLIKVQVGSPFCSPPSPPSQNIAACSTHPLSTGLSLSFSQPPCLKRRSLTIGGKIQKERTCNKEFPFPQAFPLLFSTMPPSPRGRRGKIGKRGPVTKSSTPLSPTLSFSQPYLLPREEEEGNPERGTKELWNGEMIIKH